MSMSKLLVFKSHLPNQSNVQGGIRQDMHPTEIDMIDSTCIDCAMDIPRMI